MMPGSIKLWAVTMALLAIWMPLSACAEDASPAYSVSVASVVRKDVHEWLHAYGRVGFDDAALQNINLPYSGQIIRLPMLAGEPVSKGQLLAEIAVDPSAASSYQQARAAVSFAASEVARIKKMLVNHLATKSQLAVAMKALSDSSSQLRQLREKGFGKSIHTIRASFDAVVASVSVQAGQRIAAGTTLMQLGHPDRLKVILGAEPADIRWIKTGNMVQLHSALNPDGSIHASVDRVLHAINPQTRLVDVLVRLSGSQTKSFLPGMVVSADMSARMFPNALVIPRQAAMYANSNIAYVVRIVHGKAVRVPVKVVLEKDGYALIQGELKAGQPVVTIGVAELTDGDTVTTGLAQ